MKGIILKCKGCKKNKLFHGVTVDAVMQAINDAGWMDMGSDGKNPGRADGYCPDCLEDSHRDEWAYLD